MAAQTGAIGRRDPAWRAFVEHVRATRGHLPPAVRAVVLEAAASPRAVPSGAIVGAPALEGRQLSVARGFIGRFGYRLPPTIRYLSPGH